jgi:hypothetical protein
MNETQKTTWDIFLEISQQEEKVRADFKSLGESMGLTYLEEGTLNAHFSDISPLTLEQLRALIEKSRHLGELSLRAQMALKAHDQTIGAS